MSEAAVSSGALAPDISSDIRAARSHLARRFLKNPVGITSLAVLVLIVLAAIFAPLLTSYNPNGVSVLSILQGPGAGHLLGTDGAGRDVWARLLFGARFTLAGALLATVVAAVLGIASGLIAGYYGKWFEAASSWFTTLLMALPGIVVLLAARAVLGPSLWTVMIIFGVLLIPAFYRLVFAAVSGVRNELFIDAARVSGVSDFRIIARHILTVVRAPIILQASIVFGIAIAVQVGLDFLGFGDQTIPTWGNILNDGFTNLYRDPQLVIWPGLAIVITGVALTLFANALRDELEHSARPSRRRRVAAATAAAVTAAAEPVPPVSSTIVHDEPEAATEAPLLHIEGLAVGYPQPDGSVTRVVDDVSLNIRRGEVHGLIGESGSGKTQTAWSVLGLLPSGGEILEGSIRFAGEDLSKVPSAKMQELRGGRIAYIPQEPMSNLDPSFTIGSQLTEPMRIKLGVSKAEAKARALKLLGQVGIPSPERTFASYPHELSGGMAQRVLIAGAVSCEPDLVIADEPTTALDVTIQAEILDLLRDLQQELGVTILIVTHNFGVVADLCDQVSVMQKGRIVETGPARSLFANPQHPYTRSLFDAILDESPARGPYAEVRP
ncbi:MAG TPA: dipeptide/oligopeptide/nickel ABC transporter permease/ATP-binding protein [Streptosporangiaceae bacterium]|jgi:ABC-type dipeptide/oligopeptide/nickel transport system ATPase component/ABC-type dipeptide/oligopeptide/nickel transport system permease subunit